jgi:hypothetical protein
MLIGSTLISVLSRPLDPESKQGIEEEVVALVAVEDIPGIERLESLFDGRSWTETELLGKAWE